jgi:hypothetical protein
MRWIKLFTVLASWVLAFGLMSPAANALCTGKNGVMGPCPMGISDMATQISFTAGPPPNGTLFFKPPCGCTGVLTEPFPDATAQTDGIGFNGYTGGTTPNGPMMPMTAGQQQNLTTPNIPGNGNSPTGPSTTAPPGTPPPPPLTNDATAEIIAGFIQLGASGDTQVTVNPDGSITDTYTESNSTENGTHVSVTTLTLLPDGSVNYNESVTYPNGAAIASYTAVTSADGSIQGQNTYYDANGTVTTNSFSGTIDTAGGSTSNTPAPATGTNTTGAAALAPPASPGGAAIEINETQAAGSPEVM